MTAFTIIVGAMGVVFDAIIVSVAIQDLTTDLHASSSTIQWVSTGYMVDGHEVGARERLGSTAAPAVS